MNAPSRSLESPPWTGLESPASGHARPDQASISGTTKRPWASRVVVLGATSIVVGILWDISWHRTIGRDTFWTPAHLAIYLGGILGGLTAALLIFRSTFSASPDREATVRIWGFRGPMGAWVCAWGALAMITSAPFDNWWHDAYGLDVKILSPPHTVLALGMYAIVIGALLLVLRDERLRSEQSSARGRWLLLYAGGVILAMVAVFHVEESWPNQQRNRNFYLISCAAYPLYLMALGRASRYRWGAVAIAGFYILINCAMLWILPLFPGTPRLGPIYNHVDRFVPLAFPLLLIVPAFGLDLLRHWFGKGKGWWRDWLLCLASAIAFTTLFAAVQWNFSEFLIGPGGQNWFFGADRHWAYSESLGESRMRFWSETSPRWNVPATAMTFAYSALLSFVSSRVGLWLGNWMASVRR